MTTYTKTELIDMAIDKLGENVNWTGDYDAIAVSTDQNTGWGFGRFEVTRSKGFYGNLGDVPFWQLVCTRQEFEQRVAERKASKPVERDEVTSPTIEWWDYENDQMLCNPPVGTNFEITWGSKVNWYQAFMLPTNYVAYYHYAEWKVEHLAGMCYDLEFRPLNYKPKLTERQQAGLKLWRCIHSGDSDLSEEFILKQKAFEDYCKPFDQGLLK